MLGRVFDWVAGLKKEELVEPDVFASECTFKVVPQSGHLFRIEAFSGRAAVGRIVAESFEQTKSCFVFDLIVNDEFQRRGVASALMKRALAHSECLSVVPVSIADDALLFWAHVAVEKKVSVRLGLLNQEVEALKFGMKRIPKPASGEQVAEGDEPVE